MPKSAVTLVEQKEGQLIPVAQPVVQIVTEKEFYLLKLYHVEVEWWIATNGQMEDVNNVNLKSLFQTIRDILEGRS